MLIMLNIDNTKNTIPNSLIKTLSGASQVKSVMVKKIITF